MKPAFVGLLNFIILVQATIVPKSFESAPEAQGSFGAVACEIGQCSDVGVNIMKQGGSAADAIIAASLCTGVIAAYHSGIGGGGFGLVRSPQGSGHNYEMIDFREMAPTLANETMFNDSPDPTASSIGGLAVGTPGELRGWEMLHRRHGKLPWAKLFEPVINIARNGFVVGPALASKLDASEFPFLLSDPLWAEVYAPNGKLLKEGETCVRTRLANTLEKLAYGGADAFYTGEIAENIVNAAQKRNGILRTTDLARYTTLLRTPANITYRGNRIFSTVTPSSGSVVLGALKIFEGFPGDAQDNDPAINVTTHRLIQATRFGYGERANYGDPDFTANVTSLEATFITEETAAILRSKINDTHNFNAPYYDPLQYIVLKDHGTSHLAAVDRDGIAISLTTTVNLIWGSQVMTEDGIVLNDQMDDFSSPGQMNSFGFAASPINFIQPGKRPQSSIASSIVENAETGQFIMATGSAGGSRIITATLQNLHYVLDQGMTASNALHHGRWHDQLGNTTLFEEPDLQIGLPGFPNGTVDFLSKINYNVSFVSPLNLAQGHIITQGAQGVFTAVSDPRSLEGGGAAF